MMGTRRIVGRMILTRLCAAALGLLLAVAASAPSALADDAAGRQPRGRPFVAAAADGRGLLQGRDRRRAERGARCGGQGLPGPVAVPAHRDRDAYGADQAHRGRCLVPSDRDSVRRQDRATVVAARTGGWSARSVCRSGRGTRRHVVCGRAFAGRPPPRGGRPRRLLFEARDRITFRSSISTRARSVASERFLDEINSYRLLCRRRSRGDRPGRQTTAFASTTGRRARNCSPIAIMPAMSTAWRSRRTAPDREQLRWTVAPLWTGFPPDRQTRRAGGHSSRMESRSIPPADAWRSASTTSPKVSIFDATTLAPIAEADVGGVTNGDLSSRRVVRATAATLVAGGHAHGAMEWSVAPFLCVFRSERTAPRSRRPDFVEYR